MVIVLFAVVGCDRPAKPSPSPAPKPEIRTTLSALEKQWLIDAEAGDAEAQYNLGLLYLNGTEPPSDPEQATSRFRAAAQSLLSTNTNAVRAVIDRVTVDHTKAFHWMQRAADQNHIWAQTALAEMYRKGRGTATNMDEAVRWYEAAAKGGNEWADYELALMYKEGKEVPKNREKALYWYQKSAAAGIVWAEYELGSMYEKGEEVPLDYIKAAKLYEQAAMKDHGWAEFALATLYFNGHGVEKDMTKAFQWYQRCAEQGIAEGEYMTGLMLAEAKGVNEDDVAAGKWLLLAVKTQGAPHHHEYWLALRSRLTEQQLAQVEDAVKKFIPRKEGSKTFTLP